MFSKYTAEDPEKAYKEYFGGDFMARELNKKEKEEYDRLAAQAEQISHQMDELMNKPIVYGYARVSSKGQARDGNSLEVQRNALEAAGAEVVLSDAFTGTKLDRPELDKLLREIKAGDTLIVTKLDRIARSVQQGIQLIDDLARKGVKIHVLNMGMMDDTPTGRLIRNVMLCFAEFERDMIWQRTQEGKIASGNKGGRKKKFPIEQMNHAMELLAGPYSYEDVAKMTGISKSTLIREKRLR